MPSTEAILKIGLNHYLFLSAILFSFGMIAVLMRKNVVVMLMGIELMLNAASLNFVAFGRFLDKGQTDGQIVSLFIIALAASEAAVALALGYCVYRAFNDVDLDKTDTLRG